MFLKVKHRTSMVESTCSFFFGGGVGGGVPLHEIISAVIAVQECDFCEGREGGIAQTCPQKMMVLP